MMRYMMWRNSLLIRRCVSVLLLTALFAAGMRLAAQSQTMCTGAANAACVLTWQNDNYRTGQNLSEGILLSSNVPSIGQLCSKKLDGQVFAQPLVVTNVTIPPTNGHLYKSVVRNEGTDGTDPNCWGRYCGDSSVCPLIIKNLGGNHAVDHTTI
jgi:hypothetical protein